MKAQRDLLNENPTLFWENVEKNPDLLGGLSHMEYKTQILEMAEMSPSELKSYIYISKFGKFINPVTELFDKIDKATYGFGKSLMAGVVAYFMVILLKSLGVLS